MTPRMNVRLVSLFILLLGLVIAYFAIYSPLQAARAGLPDFSVSMKGIVVTPGFLLVGLCGLVFAPAGVLTPAEPSGKKANIVMAVLFGLGCVAGAFVHHWLMGQLSALGYSFG